MCCDNLEGWDGVGIGGGMGWGVEGRLTMERTYVYL